MVDIIRETPRSIIISQNEEHSNKATVTFLSISTIFEITLTDIRQGVERCRVYIAVVQKPMEVIILLGFSLIISTMPSLPTL